jgi:hypothetical protein
LKRYNYYNSESGIPILEMNFKTIINSVYEVTGVFILWITLHFIASNLYQKFCAELTLLGFIKSVFVAQGPHCIALRWVIYNGGMVINNMWISIGIWFTGKLLKQIVPI